jgi:hypothetical protein
MLFGMSTRTLALMLASVSAVALATETPRSLPRPVLADAQQPVVGAGW